MTNTTLELCCRDPIVSRDGRPFGANQGNRMRSTGWPLPSAVAGSLRTTLGKKAGEQFSLATAKALLEVAVSGVLPVADEKLYLPAPNDCIIHPEKGVVRVTPQPLKEGGCDWPAEGLLPVMLPINEFPDDFKPKDAPAWWPVDRYGDWLAGASTMNFVSSFLNAPPAEYRTHVQLDADTGAADGGNLFTTAALPLSHLERYDVRHDAAWGERFAEITLTTRVRASGWCGTTAAELNMLHPLGGERRLVHWKAIDKNPWNCPDSVADALAEKDKVRMVLATPAIFRDGWKPGWLNGQLAGTVPGSNVSLKLVGVSIQRWRAVSGWSLAPINSEGQIDPKGKPGPKPVKRMVPAGGVYFFKVIGGSAADLKTRWLESVSDDERDQRDGFGLAVWGIW